MRIRLPVDELNRIVVALEGELVRVRRFWTGKGTEEGGNSMRLRVTGRTVLAPCAVLALSVGVATATARNDSRGNSVNAKLCQKNGWQNLFRTDGTGFTSQDDCVSYGAQGGTILTSPPASQSQLDCEANSGHFSTTDDPFGGLGMFLWSCSGYNQASAGNTIPQDCFDDGGIPTSSSTPTEFFAAPPVTSDDALAHTRSEASPRPSAARHAAGRGVPVGESMPQTPAAAREKARPVG
jgi:hypothetical protein